MTTQQHRPETDVVLASILTKELALVFWVK